MSNNSEISLTLDEAMKLFPKVLQKKVQYSVDLLRKAEKLAKAYDPDNGYYLAFSGGKDSQALYHVAKLAGVKFKAHMNFTSVDPADVIRFVRREYPDVHTIPPKDSIYNIAIRKRFLPTRRVRWCCQEFKEAAGAGKVTLIGIRHAESFRRSKRNEVEINNRKYSGDLDGLDDYRKEYFSKPRNKAKAVTIVNAEGEQTIGCISGKESILISPIIHWTEDDVWTFLNAIGAKHCNLYDEGRTRIGCIICPMSNHKLKAHDAERFPHVKRNWIKAIKAIRKEQPFLNGYIWWNVPGGNTPPEPTEAQLDEIAENIFDYWISDKNYKEWYAEKIQQKTIDFDNDKQPDKKQ